MRTVAQIDELLTSFNLLVTAIYAHPNGGMGGPLHIVLDDFNVDDASITLCVSQFCPEDWNRGQIGLVLMCHAMADLLMQFNEEQRGILMTREATVEQLMACER